MLKMTLKASGRTVNTARDAANCRASIYDASAKSRAAEREVEAATCRVDDIRSRYQQAEEALV